MASSLRNGDADAALSRVRLVSRVFDTALRIPGTDVRLGLDVLFDFLPGGGFLGGAISLYVVAEAIRCDLPWTTVIRMLGNVAVDVALSSIPVLGLAFDAVWRANERNATLFAEHVGTERDAEFVPIEIA